MKRSCASALPKENYEDGWHWCRYYAGHSDLHRSREDETAWKDGDIVQVVAIEEIRAVHDHVHDFTGGAMTCTHFGCPLTWGEFTTGGHQ